MRQEISIERFALPVFKTWDSTWFLLTSGDYDEGHYNCMTVGWGSFGNMWNLPLAMIVVRPTRYTFEFINQYDDFTLCAFPEKYRKVLGLLGSQSGRDGDKLANSGLTPQAAAHVASPVYAEADLAIECRKMYWQDFEPENFLDSRIPQQYSQNDYHRMIFGEITAVTGDLNKYLSK